MWYYHSGALAYCGMAVQRWLNATWPGRWIGRGGPIRAGSGLHPVGSCEYGDELLRSIKDG